MEKGNDTESGISETELTTRIFNRELLSFGKLDTIFFVKFPFFYDLELNDFISISYYFFRESVHIKSPL